MALAIDATTRA